MHHMQVLLKSCVYSCRLEAARACQLDVLVVSERLADAAAAKLFPVNALRNLALLSAKTELVMLGDLDLLAGRDLAAAVAGPQQCVLAFIASQTRLMIRGALDLLA